MGKSENYGFFFFFFFFFFEKLLQPETCKVVDAKQLMESMKVTM